MKLKNVTVGGTTYEIHVQESSGYFYATDEGSTVPKVEPNRYLDTVMEKLQKREKAKRVRINVPYVAVQNGRLVDAVITGKHKGTDKWLVKIGDKTEQLSTYEFAGYRCYRPMSDEEKAEYVRLQQAITAATKAKENFVMEKGLQWENLRSKVEHAWEKAVSEQWAKQ